MLKRENSITISYKRRVARMLFIIVTIFILLHIPFTVLIFLRTKLLKTAIMNQLTGKIYLLSWFAHFCLFANAAINPVVYGLTNDNFRRAYHQTPIIPKRFGRFWLNLVNKFKFEVCIRSKKKKKHNPWRCSNIQLFICKTNVPSIWWAVSFYLFFSEKFCEERENRCTTDYLSSYTGNNA